MRVIFLFVDGVGLGEENLNNPFYNNIFNGFQFMAGGQSFNSKAQRIKNRFHLFTPVDANLDVAGLPQSGTGQSALFSGENAAKVIGKHFGPFLHSGTKHLLKHHGVFHRALNAGKSCGFINAYPDIFFEKAEEKNRWSCTTFMTKSAGLPLNGLEQVKNEEALTAGITQQAWKEELGIAVPHISPETAAQRLLEQSKKYDLLLYEYYLTDKAGHSRSHPKAEKSMSVYNRFLWTVISEKPDDITIVLSSDHGNIEDLSTKTHTRNKVPLFVYGPGAALFFSAKSILDVTPGILKVLEK